MKNITTGSLNGSVITDNLTREKSKNGETHWIEKQDDSRYPNIPVSTPATRNFAASMEYNGNLDNGSSRSDYRLACWQYMNNTSGSRISTGFWLMAGRYE